MENITFYKVNKSVDRMRITFALKIFTLFSLETK